MTAVLFQDAAEQATQKASRDAEVVVSKTLQAAKPGKLDKLTETAEELRR